MSRHDVPKRRGGPTVSKGRRGPRTGPKPSLKMRVLGWGSIAFTCLLVVSSLYFYSVYRDDVNSIHQIKITGLGKRPPKYTNALNILLKSGRGAGACPGAAGRGGPGNGAVSPGRRA